MLMRTLSPQLPALPLDAWEDSKLTLHLYLQIVGKIRMALMPRKNHWWNITLYINPKGLTTHAIPYAEGQETFEITFNFIEHRLELFTSRGEHQSFPLEEGLTVANFYRQLFDMLETMGIEVEITALPYDLPVTQPFEELTAISAYQKDYIERFWRILMWVDGVFKAFSGRFYGKTCPVHLYWHHMDLAVTRFSGQPGPPMGADWGTADKDAYSHEVISFGFWAGDDNVRGPAFYAYAYPSPDGLDQQPLQPTTAQWVDNNGSPMALLMYEDLLKEENPRQALFDFLESSYQAGAQLAQWDIASLEVPPLAAL